MIAIRESAVVITIALAAAVLVALKLSGQLLPAVAAKFIASSGFVLLAWRAGAADTAYGRRIAAGLVLSWCGDLLLEGSGDRWFLAGLAAFLLAHVAYIAAFVRRGLAPGAALAAALAVGLVSFGVLSYLVPFLPHRLALPVMAYAVVISVMVACAVGTGARNASVQVPLGALLFYLSDLSVAAVRFLDLSFPHYLWGLPCYFAGQTLLARSVAAATRR